MYHFSGGNRKSGLTFQQLQGDACCRYYRVITGFNLCDVVRAFRDYRFYGVLSGFKRFPEAFVLYRELQALLSARRCPDMEAMHSLFAFPKMVRVTITTRS
jgi:hypothetical protein